MKMRHTTAGRPIRRWSLALLLKIDRAQLFALGASASSFFSLWPRTRRRLSARALWSAAEINHRQFKCRSSISPADQPDAIKIHLKMLQRK
jgi:hypothetical protein